LRIKNPGCKDEPMAVGLTFALLAPVAAAASTVPPASGGTAAPPKAPAVRQDGCAVPQPKADTQQIVICAPKSDGYRLNPDVIEAKREVHSPGRRPMQGQGGMRRDQPCQSGIGPAPCFNAGINLIAAAVTAAEMAKRVAEGKEIGSMFATDPHPDEYHLYLMAKARREAREAQAAAAKKAKAAPVGKVDTPAPAAAQPATK
jgi:hypothetical protein